MKFQIKVQPNSSRQEIQTNLEGQVIKIYLQKPAIEGKANKELEKLLSKYYKAKATIIKGHTSKTKTIEVKK